MTIILVSRLLTDLCRAPLVHVDDEGRVAGVPTGANVCVNGPLGSLPDGAVGAADKDVDHAAGR
jgi:hypothetical protein